jgi:hypothetical protein
MVKTDNLSPAGVYDAATHRMLIRRARTSNAASRASRRSNPP